MKRWNVVARKPRGEFSVGAPVASVAFSPDGRTLASTTWGDRLELWDVATGKPLGKSLRVGGSVTSLAFIPDGGTLAVGRQDGTVILLDVATGKTLGEPLKVGTVVTSVAFRPDGKIWDVARRKPWGEPLGGHWETISSAAIGSSGELLSFGSGTKTVIPEMRQDIHHAFAPGSKGKVRSIAFSPIGKILASGSEDHTVILWDVAARKPLGQPLVGHKGAVTSVAVSPDGKTLASSSADRTVILWDVGLASWRDLACAIANRNLTCEEWRSYIGERSYLKVCERLPAPQCP